MLTFWFLPKEYAQNGIWKTLNLKVQNQLSKSKQTNFQLELRFKTNFLNPSKQTWPQNACERIQFKKLTFAGVCCMYMANYVLWFCTSMLTRMDFALLAKMKLSYNMLSASTHTTKVLSIKNWDTIWSMDVKMFVVANIVRQEQA